MSYADNYTDEMLEELEKKIGKVYSDAQKDFEKQSKEYFEKFAKRDEEYHKLVDEGKITEKEYKQWRLNQIGRGERLDKMAAQMAERATSANEVAVAYVNDATPSIYSLNRNHEAYVIETLGHDMSVGGDFTLLNESSVRRLMVTDPDVMPYYPKERAIQRGIDLEYGQKYIKKHVTSGILQGKSVYKIADDLQKDLTNMERASAIRTARTAVTSAQNGGRQDTMNAARAMGIKLPKRWVAVKDSRTRDIHGKADGQTVDSDKPFIVGGEKMMFPGDPSASGWNFYNCRCGMRTVEKEGIEAEQRQVRVRNPEWEKAHEDEEKAKARYERALEKEKAETDPEKKKELRKQRLEKQHEYEHYSEIRKGTQKNIVVNGDMTYEEWAKLRGVKLKKQSTTQLVSPWQQLPDEITERMNIIDGLVSKETGLNSVFNGKVIIDNNMRYNGLANYDGSIALRANATTKTQVHEVLHQHSIGGQNKMNVYLYKNIEEGSVELLAQEICKKNNIPIGQFDYSYSSYVDSLRIINAKTNKFSSDYDFAMYLFKLPLNERSSYLKTLAENVPKDEKRFVKGALSKLGVK